MAVAFFPSLENAKTIEVAFSTPQGGEVSRCFLVDSGFTGESCFVLPESEAGLAQAQAPASEAAGALRGAQKRVVVSYSIPALSFRFEGIAILADVSPLSLPQGIHGLVGCGSYGSFAAGEPSRPRKAGGISSLQPI
jgi:predicted aspartyl protease